VHILVDCPRLNEVRQQLRTKIGDAFNSLASMLGGNEADAQGGKKQKPIDREVIDAVIEFADKSGRFKSRVPRQR
jgi:hypothetical protein